MSWDTDLMLDRIKQAFDKPIPSEEVARLSEEAWAEMPEVENEYDDDPDEDDSPPDGGLAAFVARHKSEGD
jgi:hypothetical protein